MSQITFDLVENNSLADNGADEEITCIACGLRLCEGIDLGWLIKVAVPYTGRRTWAGIHDECKRKHEARLE